MRLWVMALTLIAAISSAGLVRAVGPQKMITVAANGSAPFKTLQAAVNAVPNNSKSPVIIFIKPGIYRGLVVVGRHKPVKDDSSHWAGSPTGQSVLLISIGGQGRHMPPVSRSQDGFGGDFCRLGFG